MVDRESGEKFLETMMNDGKKHTERQDKLRRLYEEAKELEISLGIKHSLKKIREGLYDDETRGKMENEILENHLNAVKARHTINPHKTTNEDVQEVESAVSHLNGIRKQIRELEAEGKAFYGKYMGRTLAGSKKVVCDMKRLRTKYGILRK
ncbi:MAG: hypothetical protein QXU82_02820 [Candidatus Aenigmatarchaeota archaeon]